ncbi:MAG: type IV pili methyl-accepting chemotaxis transducer N-terminal domain-containing protein [Candidatus Sedimenticola sp. (ex Thyasira tokunagai)]
MVIVDSIGGIKRVLMDWLNLPMPGASASAESDLINYPSHTPASFTGFRSTVVLLLSTLFLTSPLQAGVTDIQDAINKSGKQRMLTQKIMGSYAMLGVNFQPKKSKQRLQDSIALFESQLSDLKGYQVNDAVSRQFDAVEKLWTPLKEQLSAEPEMGKAVAISKGLDGLMASSDKAVLLITKASGTAAGEIVNISGRQRMLSQRMNALYMLRVWGVKGFDYEAAFNKAVNEFNVSHAKLVNSKLTMGEIKKKLDLTEKSFIWFERSTMKQTGTYVPALVLRAADRILGHMNAATMLYANLKK